MIRSLAMIAIAGAIISLICLASAASLGFQATKGWPFPMQWSFDSDNGDWDRGTYLRLDWNSPIISKTVEWSGDDDIEINIPAEVTITEADQPKLVVTGPTDVVNHVTVSGGEIRFDNDNRGRINVRGVHGLDDLHKLRIEISAHGLHKVAAKVASKVHLVGLKSDDLELDVNTASDADGSVDVDRLRVRVHTGADARLEGRADDLDVEVHTGGDARLDRLATKTARVEAHTGGSAIIAAKDSVDAEAHTGGDIVVRGRPPHVNSNTHTGGNLRFDESAPMPEPATPEPPAKPGVSPSPSPSASPSPPKKT